MKNSNEILKTVLARRDEYIRKRNRTIKRITAVGSTVCALVLITFSANYMSDKVIPSVDDKPFSDFSDDYGTKTTSAVTENVIESNIQITTTEKIGNPVVSGMVSEVYTDNSDNDTHTTSAEKMTEAETIQQNTTQKVYNSEITTQAVFNPTESTIPAVTTQPAETLPIHTEAETTGTPVRTTVAPETTIVPVITTVAPETTIVPVITTVAPVTTKAPVRTTVAPMTTKAPIITTIAPTTTMGWITMQPQTIGTTAHTTAAAQTQGPATLPAETSSMYYILYEEIDTTGLEEYEIENYHTEATMKILDEIGVEHSKAWYSKYTSAIMCELDNEQFERAKQSQLIISISKF